LKDNDSKENTASNVDFETEQNHDNAAKLAKKIGEYEQTCEEIATSPRHVHVVTLLGPLGVHTDSIFEKRRNEAEARKMWQNVLCTAEHLTMKENEINRGSVVQLESTLRFRG
jgi:hypothetical protein